MSSGWICWRYENVGEFVPFLLKVAGICHFSITSFSRVVVFTHLPFPELSFSPTFFNRFTHLQFSLTCRFRFKPIIFSTWPTGRLHQRVDFVFTHLFFRFTHLQISPNCRFRFQPIVFPASPTCRFHLLVDFVFTQLFSRFTYLQISPTRRFHCYPLLFHVSTTCRFHLLDFTHLQISSISPTCRLNLFALVLCYDSDV